MIDRYFIYSPKHTRRGDPYITFWRPDRAGYVWPLERAGSYTEEEAREIAYSDALPVPVWKAIKLSSKPRPNTIDGDAGPAVRNTKANREALVTAAEFVSSQTLKREVA